MKRASLPDQTTTRGSAPTLAECAAAAVIATSNVALNRFVQQPFAVPAGVAASLGMVALAAGSGASASGMGIRADTARRGLVAGAVIGLPVAAAIAFGAWHPLTRRFFRDERIVAASMGEAAHELLVRMPLATAAGEELMFRAGLEGLLGARRSRTASVVASAVAFGAWHILPTLDRVHSNPGVADTHRGSRLRQAAIVAAVVTSTALAGVGFSFVQRRTKSVIAPIVLHYAINASAYASGWMIHRADQQAAERTSASADG